ncbi:Undecaprenyl-phosphate galactose phosphotransferase [Tepidanaerobacter acetatoxydans Re1]|uniref:Undecaprenyl-phosphate galactose phosphotransferase n=2 Tax=Tepidanaerobacter acetatoxydans TaxID=499229 RepID=F4LXA9_TEPAE|nr:Undecaprenyl-phosphate galactose phosphotransferase [Tepidanaerobacter acetatoxydans Re1]CCP26732.1 Undecaprenyl-phosphate galactose phosphotransferase [Tepidanaerobacter acetatoxydans Re1]
MLAIIADTEKLIKTLKVLWNIMANIELNSNKTITNLTPQQGGLYRRYFKRPIDFTLSLLAIIALSPVLAIIAIIVKVNLGSPVIFRQERPGLNEKIFTLYKFRTMTDKRDQNGDLLPDEVRLTNFGKFLRSTSLDELPELFNILKGDMSIVGPRPLLVQYLPLYNDHQRRRHEVRPGLSGLAQVNGRNAISWEEKFDLDVKYVENVSFFGDLKIIFKTVVKVIKREGINKDANMTMEPFRGSKNFNV